jgi:hypothetical protein
MVIFPGKVCGATLHFVVFYPVDFGVGNGQDVLLSLFACVLERYYRLEDLNFKFLG